MTGATRGTGTAALLRWMVREEWRLHSHLFGGRRFAGFPLAIAAITALGTWALAITGTDPGATAAGLHGLLALLGLQIGTVLLVGQDALQDVFGHVTLLLFSARTLPVSRRHLLATFLVKDLLFYGGLVITPVLVGFGAVAVARGLAPATVALAWVSVTLAFALGLGASLALAALGSRNPAAVGVALLALVVAVVGGWLDPLAVTPYRLFAAPSLVNAVAAVVPALALGATGVALFDPDAADTDGGRRRFERPLARVDDAMTRRALLTVARSSGSVWKVLFSLGVMVGVTALVLEQVVAATGIRPHAGVTFGTLLALGAFTTYTSVADFADEREYLRYPIGYDAVLRGTLRAYLLLAVGSGLIYLAVAAHWFPVAELAVGVAILPPVAVYVFGVSAYLTGLSPNELLFDTPLFVAFGAALAVAAIPLLVAALAVPVAPMAAVAAALAVAWVAGGVGLVLTRRAGPRIEGRLRA